MGQVDLESFSQILKSKETLTLLKADHSFCSFVEIIPLCSQSWNWIRNMSQAIYRDISYGRPFGTLKTLTNNLQKIQLTVGIWLTIALITLFSEPPEKFLTECASEKRTRGKGMDTGGTKCVANTHQNVGWRKNFATNLWPLISCVLSTKKWKWKEIMWNFVTPMELVAMLGILLMLDRSTTIRQPPHSCICVLGQYPIET